MPHMLQGWYSSLLLLFQVGGWWVVGGWRFNSVVRVRLTEPSLAGVGTGWLGLSLAIVHIIGLGEYFLLLRHFNMKSEYHFFQPIRWLF